MFIQRKPTAEEKLATLSQDSRYDLACACGTADDEHRRRGRDQKWIYPVTLPTGRTTFLFKTLLSNECAGSCKYCPLRASADVRRTSLAPEEVARTFLAYERAGRVGGLFLSSAVTRDPDTTMERLNRTARLLRREFRGYIHLKIIPGASDEAIRESLSLASAVSLNIETPGEKNFRRLCSTKDYHRDIVHPINLISRLTAKGAPFTRVKQTTQFVVGASDETDREIIDCAGKLYRELAMHRLYFSAYQRGAGDPGLPGERSAASNGELLTREHRLYQVDWLLRKYGFDASEIPVDDGGNLSLATDPKEMWARLHPEYFPVNVNRAEKEQLLRVPGLGEVMVSRILASRKGGARLRSLSDLGRQTKILRKAQAYVTF